MVRVVEDWGGGWWAKCVRVCWSVEGGGAPAVRAGGGAVWGEVAKAWLAGATLRSLRVRGCERVVGRRERGGRGAGHAVQHGGGCGAGKEGGGIGALLGALLLTNRPAAQQVCDAHS